MGRFITPRGNKNYGVLEKNLKRPPDQFLLVLRAFLMGVLEKRVFFGGVFVVNSWWMRDKRGVKDGCLFGHEKPATFCRFIFGVCLEISYSMASSCTESGSPSNMSDIGPRPAAVG
jgi:hypothetical protein